MRIRDKGITYITHNVHVHVYVKLVLLVHVSTCVSIRKIR